MDKPFEHIALIGLGLIASSIALALHRLPNRPKITGYARSQKTRDEAKSLGFCDEIADSAENAVKNADLVIFCIPVGAMEKVMERIAPHIQDHAVISDVGSTKQSVIEAIMPHLPKTASLVPAHPLAGTEKSGPKAGFASLFDNRWCILTPIEDDENVQKMRVFWEFLGAKVDIMEAQHHDLVLAATSHVPHAIAFTMVGVADDLSRVTEAEVIKYSAAGFRDFTRIAASDPTMWRDVFLANKDRTLEVLERFTEELETVKNAIRSSDGAFLYDYFARTGEIRRSILEIGQDVDLPDFGRQNLNAQNMIESHENTKN